MDYDFDGKAGRNPLNFERSKLQTTLTHELDNDKFRSDKSQPIIMHLTYELFLLFVAYVNKSVQQHLLLFR